MPRLPRLNISHEYAMPSAGAIPPNVRARIGSPVGASTLMTSAPQSANTAPAEGTNAHIATSMTRTPWSGWFTMCSSFRPGGLDGVRSQTPPTRDFHGGARDVAGRG